MRSAFLQNIHRRFRNKTITAGLFELVESPSNPAVALGKHNDSTRAQPDVAILSEHPTKADEHT
jgi:hypothetical protein